jgi:glutathione S-transferase
VLTIYHVPGTRSARIIWLCEELDHPYRVETIDFSPDYRASPEWRALNPVGKVPAMRDDGFSMFESGAMLEYILERYGDGRLRPAPGTPAAAEYLQWCWFAEATFARPLGDMAHHMFLKPEPERIVAVVEDGRHRAVSCIEALQEALAERRYLLGDTFTAADIMMGYSLVLGRRVGALQPEHQTAMSYLDRLVQRPAFQKAFPS